MRTNKELKSYAHSESSISRYKDLPSSARKLMPDGSPRLPRSPGNKEGEQSDLVMISEKTDTFYALKCNMGKNPITKLTKFTSN